MKYKLIAMDLDGTLTQHKSKLEDKNMDLLNRLSQKYKLVIVGAGSCDRIYNQMNKYPIAIIGNYGMQRSEILEGKFVVVKNDNYSVDTNFFQTTIDNIRKETGYTHFKGNSVEFHESGAVTFPLLGTAAELKNKLAFDPNGRKRMAIYDRVSNAFGDYNCFIGGTSSFDIVKKGYDKYNALVKYAKNFDIKEDEIFFIGDDFKPGGNDEQIKLNGIDYIEIKDYTKVSERLSEKQII